MVLLIRFPSKTNHIQFHGTNISPFIIWKYWYHPPWMLILHMLQIFCIIGFLLTVAQPSVKDLSSFRNIFISLLYPDGDENLPFADIDQITSFFDKFFDNLERLFSYSFMEFSFEDPTEPFMAYIVWKNGSLTKTHVISPDSRFFQHVQSFSIQSKFYSSSTQGPITGCTNWVLDVLIQKPSGSFCFQPFPSLRRKSCSGHIIHDSDQRTKSHNSFVKRRNKRGQSILYDPTKYVDDLKKIEDMYNRIDHGKLLNYGQNSQYIERNTPSFIRSSISLYPPIIRFSFLLAAFSCLSTILVFINVVIKFKRLNHLVQVDLTVRDLPPIQRFHQNIGMWDPLFLLTSLTALLSSFYSIFDTQYLSQYPSPSSLHIFGIGSFLLIISCLRWFIQIPKCYRVVIIIREAVLRLMNVAFAQSPIFISMMFVSIFLFGFITEISSHYISVFEAILALTFGDNIWEVYNAYTDGSSEYNIHSFIFVSLMTAVTMWLFFTTFTASMTYLHKHVISKYYQR